MKLAKSRHFCAGSETRKIALNGSCCASRLAPTASGPKASSATPATASQLRSHHGRVTHMTAEARPKPSMASETTSEPKCAQEPIWKMRMMAICSAMIAPAISPIVT